MSTDTWADNRDFARANAFEFPLLSDWPARATVKAFGLLADDGTSKRATLIVDAAGVIQGVVDGVAAGAHATKALAVLQARRDGVVN